ncbi:hypothetical protein VTP01DRAFT_8078 [Rhizomucor pusillus]|uniref:uncharacterized protein n=1 Tax=Rhizomucor pusillus TaxID=4840 RepID=UPI0037440D3D
MASSMSRIEITFFSSTVYDVEEYQLILDQTLEPFSFFAIYVQDKGILGYSHWWNSITRKKQGVCRSRVDGKDLIQLLSNFSFNDRPIHCLILETASDEDQSHSPYYPYSIIGTHGQVEANGTLIDWPWYRLRKATKDREASTVCSIQLYEENIRSMPSGDHVRVDDGRLVEMRNLLRSTDYKADYNVLVPGFRCSSQRLASVVEKYIQRGDIFTIHVDGIVKRRGFKEIHARIE